MLENVETFSSRFLTISIQQSIVNCFHRFNTMIRPMTLLYLIPSLNLFLHFTTIDLGINQIIQNF